MSMETGENTIHQNIVKRHGGLLGLCAIVYSCPYDISCSYLPEVVTYLCDFINDPVPIQVILTILLS